MNNAPRTTNRLKLAYFGTPDFSAAFLEKLLTDPELPIEVVLVVTQPDKKIGRKQVVTPTPVKLVAQKYGVEIVDDITFHVLRSTLHNVDLALVYAFGEIIPEKLLEIPKYGFWNVHPSLLPKYRGPSPIATPLIEGAKETGVTLIKMDKEIDHGPIIAKERVAIGEKERRPDMERKLTEMGYELFKITVKYLTVIGEVKAGVQDHEKATFTKRLTKQDGFINIENLKFKIENSPKEIFNLFRGLCPWPGIWTTIKLKVESGKLKVVEKRLKITDMDLIDGRLVIRKVQLEGKNEVDFTTFNRAYKVF